ncbi:hypothetical protein HID58_087430 [Brassica napus]|uniref:Uncharacterized protein n=1 Tax=Brassica napus TaxID=3708 RepID=A0ABQ7XUM3_BRANA|nr:hypothetical protein HID58_087430 [Brassica napus]
MVQKVRYHSYTEDMGVEVSRTGQDQVELAGRADSRDGRTRRRTQPCDGSARRRADRRADRRVVALAQRADRRYESAVIPVQVPEVSAQPSGSSTTPVPAPKEEKATELMPPPLDRKEIVLGLPASSAAPLTKSHKRTGVATETVKKRRCTAGAEGERSGPLSQHRAMAFWASSGLPFWPFVG